MQKLLLSVTLLGMAMLAPGAWAQIPNQQSDADILGVLSIIDHNEIQAAPKSFAALRDPQSTAKAQEIQSHQNMGQS